MKWNRETESKEHRKRRVKMALEGMSQKAIDTMFLRENRDYEEELDRKIEEAKQRNVEESISEINEVLLDIALSDKNFFYEVAEFVKANASNPEVKSMIIILNRSNNDIWEIRAQILPKKTEFLELKEKTRK